MAKQTATVVKTQAAAIATALNTAFDDTGATGNMEAFWKDPRNPLRDIRNLVTLDNAGQFAANDDLIDDVYADNYPQQFINDHYKIIP
jgi:hypothetical protein